MGKGVQSAWSRDTSVLYSVFITVAGWCFLVKVGESQSSQCGSVSSEARGKPPREQASPAVPRLTLDLLLAARAPLPQRPEIPSSIQIQGWEANSPQPPATLSGLYHNPLYFPRSKDCWALIEVLSLDCFFLLLFFSLANPLSI